MASNSKYSVPTGLIEDTHITAAQYEMLYRQSIDEPELFWDAQARKYLTWFEKWTAVKNCDFGTGEANKYSTFINSLYGKGLKFNSYFSFIILLSFLKIIISVISVILL